MDINYFRRVLISFADEASNVEVRLGKVVAQIRDEVIEASLTFKDGDDQQIQVVENGETLSARSWIANRIARLPQLAERILINSGAGNDSASEASFIVPHGLLASDISSSPGKSGDTVVLDAVDVLMQNCSNPLPGATSVIYLTSDAGEGKTTAINKAARLQATRFRSKIVSSLIVPIPLSGRAFLTFDDAVVAALVNKLRFNYLYFDSFIQLVRLGLVIPAFDGYEEMLVEGSRGEAISALGNLVETLESSGTVIVAARKAFFEYLSFKTQARLLDAIGDRSAAFSRLALTRWDRAQFVEYGTLRKAEQPQEIYEMVAARLGTDHPLLTRAVLVRRLFDVAESKSSRSQLAASLGNNPNDYFFTFVDAIIRREASEKWLSRVSGDVMVPLLTVAGHHQLLGQIAQEMWQSSKTSVRHDVMDVIVDIFGESAKKGAAEVRQIKERLKQHSLLSTDSTRGNALAFDHEDFYNFFLGESLGYLLVSNARSELQAFISVAAIPVVTVDQAVHYAIRHGANLKDVLQNIVDINAFELGFTFCKENCGLLSLRIVECLPGTDSFELTAMTFAPNALQSKAFSNVVFTDCQFQPTATSNSSLINIMFDGCEFERIECDAEYSLKGCTFKSCRIQSLVTSSDGDLIFDPAVILRDMVKLGAHLNEGVPQMEMSFDERIKVLQRFLRIFLRSTHVDEEFIKLRLGKALGPIFFDSILTEIITAGVLDDVQWKGQGIQRRFKLAMPLSHIENALESSQGDFQLFLKIVEMH